MFLCNKYHVISHVHATSQANSYIKRSSRAHNYKSIGVARLPCRVYDRSPGVSVASVNPAQVSSPYYAYFCTPIFLFQACLKFLIFRLGSWIPGIFLCSLATPVDKSTRKL